jgi:2-methylisocitrate lyase-like PEP mutase family enzyme
MARTPHLRAALTGRCSLGIEEAITRLRRAGEAGADVAFVEGMTSREDVEKAVAALSPMPVLLNLVHGGSTPDFTAQEAQEMGVKMVVRSVRLCRAASD